MISATNAEYEAIANMFADAYAAEPFMKWALGDAFNRENLYTYFKLLLEFVYGKHRLVFANEQLTAACVLAPPGACQMTEGEVRAMGREYADLLAPQWLRIEEGVRRMALHDPAGTHFHVVAVGVLPEVQQSGAASELVRHVLEEVGTGTSFYAELTTDKSWRLFARHGFLLLGEEDLAADGPHVRYASRV